MLYVCFFFEYYGVINVWRNEIIEVYVLKWIIIGKNKYNY